MTDLVPSNPQPQLPAALVSPEGPGAVMRAYLDRLNPNTVDAYRRDVMVFARFLAEHKAIAPVAQTYNEPDATRAAAWILGRTQGQANQVALKYRQWLVAQKGGDGRPLAGATVDRRLSALKSLVRCGRLVGMISWSIEVDGIGKQGAMKTRDVRGPGKDGVQLMLAALDKRYAKACALKSHHPHRADEAKFYAMAVLRDRALIWLLYAMALRCFEAGGLCVGDVNVAARKLRVRRKGDHGQSRVLTIPTKVLAHLDRWIRSRGPVAREAPLFVSLNNLQVGDSFLTERSIRRVVTRVGAEAGLKTWPHGLRHAGITEALDVMKGDVRAVSKFSGHAKIETVMRYDDERRDQQGNIADMVAEGL